MLLIMKSILCVILLCGWCFYPKPIEAKPIEAGAIEVGAIEAVTIAHADGNYFPVEYVRQGEFTGIHPQILRAVAKDLNITIRFVSMPWKRAIHWLKAGKIDALTHIAYTEQRSAFAEFHPGNIISSSGTWAIVLASRRGEFDFDGTLQSLRKSVFAVGSGYRYGEPFDSAGFIQRFNVEKPTPAILTELLLRRRVDIILHSRRGLRQVFSDKHIGENYHIFEQQVATNNNYIAFSKAANHQALAMRFADAISQYKTTAPWRQLMDYYHKQLEALGPL